MRSWSGWLALFAFFATLASSSVARADGPARLRVLTWNVWCVPAITSHLDERMAAIPDAVAALGADVVLFQELWVAKHAESVARRLRERGYRDTRRFESPAGDTGLFVASKLPLGPSTFRSFSIGRMPHSLWHLDWLVEKGLADVVVATPLGPLRVENTHLQAQYRTDRYAPERLAQATELVLLGGEHELEPLVLAGDFNGSDDELPRRVIRDLGALADAHRSSNEDSVYVRGSRTLAIRIVSARTALDEPYPLGDGSREPLSDHPALVVDLELSRCTDCASERRVTTATRNAVLTSLSRAAGITPFRMILALLTACALAVLGVGWKRRMGPVTAGPRRRVALRLVGLTLLGAGFVWSAYLGGFYYPERAQALRNIAQALETATEAPPPDASRRSP